MKRIADGRIMQCSVDRNDDITFLHYTDGTLGIKIFSFSFTKDPHKTLSVELTEQDADELTDLLIKWRSEHEGNGDT